LDLSLNCLSLYACSCIPSPCNDVAVSVDLNVVMDNEGKLIEVQGIGELDTFSHYQLNQMLDVAEKRISELLRYQQL